MLNTVIIGAGPYGLSVAAHLRHRGIPFRIFGRLMDSWLSHMPKGMLLKSDGFASNIEDPERAFTLRHFCLEKGIDYGEAGVPVRLETFAGYGVEFRNRMVPELEEKFVVSVDRVQGGFVVALNDGETLKAQQVLLAVGITHFEYIPESLAHLPPQLLSHSAAHSDISAFSGRSVIVIGGGASALDLAGLLHEAGANVQLVARKRQLKFHGKSNGGTRSWWQRIKHPKSGLGPGWRSRFYANWAWLFYYLPGKLRLKVVRRALGPAGGPFIHDKVVGKVPLHLGYTVLSAEAQGGNVRLRLGAHDGTLKELVAEHIISATGYKVDMERLTFLSPAIRSHLRVVGGSPVLSSSFESSVKGLYFVGLTAANSFGPVMRFACGARFAAPTVTKALAKSLSRGSAVVPMSAAAAIPK
jgi:cation diffusion facilitator CzcD-associated flavoprotein CzcO